MVTTRRFTPCLWFADEAETAARYYVDGQSFTALNRGPLFKFNEAVSIQVNCSTEDEIDYYWDKLLAGGDPKAQQCGWLKDKFGLSWQIVPNFMAELFKDEKSEGSQRAMEAMLTMKKLDINAIRRAHDGK
jgi:predicted 3-demethylubiquinone-9 3-methyltransferase (glyoxalase superfamily)